MLRLKKYRAKRLAQITPLCAHTFWTFLLIAFTSSRNLVAFWKDMRRLTFIFFKLSLLQLRLTTGKRSCSVRELSLHTCCIFSHVWYQQPWRIQFFSPILRWRSSTSNLWQLLIRYRQPQVKKKKHVGAPLDLNWHCSDGSYEGPVLGVCWCMREASLPPKLSFSAVHRSVFLTCVAPLQNKQRWEKTDPNSLSTPSFPQSLHENRWLWHYQQSQLVSHACSEGGRINWPLPFLQSQWWKGLLFVAACLLLFCTVINIFR